MELVLEVLVALRSDVRGGVDLIRKLLPAGKPDNQCQKKKAEQEGTYTTGDVTVCHEECQVFTKWNI